MQPIIIFTDGACRPNPGFGGYGALIECALLKHELCGGVPNTTNNRMELQACVEALQFLNPATKRKVILYTDSKYVQDGITDYMPGWKRRNWKTSKRKPIKNKDLWTILDALNGKFNITWKWVRGHNGLHGNERADELAEIGLLEVRRLFPNGFNIQKGQARNQHP